MIARAESLSLVPAPRDHHSGVKCIIGTSLSEPIYKELGGLGPPGLLRDDHMTFDAISIYISITTEITTYLFETCGTVMAEEAENTYAKQYFEAVRDGQLQKVKELLSEKKVQVDTTNQVL